MTIMAILSGSIADAAQKKKKTYAPGKARPDHFEAGLLSLKAMHAQTKALVSKTFAGPFAALVVELPEAVEAAAAVAHHLAGLADIAELLGKLQLQFWHG